MVPSVTSPGHLRQQPQSNRVLTSLSLAENPWTWSTLTAGAAGSPQPSLLRDWRRQRRGRPAGLRLPARIVAGGQPQARRQLGSGLHAVDEIQLHGHRAASAGQPRRHGLLLHDRVSRERAYGGPRVAAFQSADQALAYLVGVHAAAGRPGHAGRGSFFRRGRRVLLRRHTEWKAAAGAVRVDARRPRASPVDASVLL